MRIGLGFVEVGISGILSQYAWVAGPAGIALSVIGAIIPLFSKLAPFAGPSGGVVATPSNPHSAPFSQFASLDGQAVPLDHRIDLVQQALRGVQAELDNETEPQGWKQRGGEWWRMRMTEIQTLQEEWSALDKLKRQPPPQPAAEAPAAQPMIPTAPVITPPSQRQDQQGPALSSDRPAVSAPSVTTEPQAPAIAQPSNPIAPLTEPPVATGGKQPDVSIIPAIALAPAAAIPFFQPGQTSGGSPMDFTNPSYPSTQPDSTWPALIGDIWNATAPLILPKPAVQPAAPQQQIIDVISQIPWWVYVLGGIAVYSMLEGRSGGRR